MAERKLEVKILGDSRSLERALGRSSSATRRFGRESKLGAAGMGLIAGAAAGATVAIGSGLARALGNAVEGFQAQARVSAQTAATLKSTGKAAGVTQKHIEGMANAIERQTGLEADAVQQGQNLLLTFTKISNAGPDKIFDRATRAAVDLSVAFGKDLSGSSIMLGKALQDPAKGVTALTRVGVSFTQGQKETIKSLTESGRVADAQKLILRELETQVQGSARAFGDSVPGKIAKAKRSFEAMSESVVESLIPALDALLPLATRGMQSIAPVIQTVARSFSDLVVQIAKSDEFRKIAQAFRDIAVAGVQVLSAALQVAIPLVLAIVAPIASLASALTRSSFAMGVLTAAFASFIALRVVSHITAAAGAIRTLATASAASVGITSLSNSFRMLTLGMTSVSARAAGLAPGLTAAAGGISRTSIAAGTARASVARLGGALSGALGGPVGIAITATATLATIIGGDLISSFSRSKDEAYNYAGAMDRVGSATQGVTDSLSGLVDAMLNNADAQSSTARATAERAAAERTLRGLEAAGITSGPQYVAAITRQRDARNAEARAIKAAGDSATTYGQKQDEVKGKTLTLGTALSGSVNALARQRMSLMLGVQAGTIARSEYDKLVVSMGKKLMGTPQLASFRAEALKMIPVLNAQGTPAAKNLAAALDGVVRARTPEQLAKFLGRVVTLTGGTDKDVDKLVKDINNNFGKVGSKPPSRTFFDTTTRLAQGTTAALQAIINKSAEAERTVGRRGGQRAGSRENSTGGFGPNAMSFFYSQRSAAASAGAGLSGMAREGFISRDPEAQAINARRKARQQDLNALQQRELEARVASAETADERRRAEIDLAEFLDALAWERVETEADAHAQNIDNLASQFARGEISAETYKTKLDALIGGATGASNGKLFGEEWVAAFELALGDGSALRAIIANALGGQTGAQPIGGPDPEDAPDASGKYPTGANFGPWASKATRDRAFTALDADLKKRAGKIRTGREGDYKYGIRIKPLAEGGILQRAILAGEAGPEAVIPLTGTRGRDYMARVMADVAKGNRGAGTVVVNVAGNEFSAEAFARKIGPELRRQIALTGSY